MNQPESTRRPFYTSHQSCSATIPGVSYAGVRMLDQRMTEWLAWRQEGAPCPSWHPQSKGGTVQLVEKEVRTHFVFGRQAQEETK